MKQAFCLLCRRLDFTLKLQNFRVAVHSFSSACVRIACSIVWKLFTISFSQKKSPGIAQGRRSLLFKVCIILENVVFHMIYIFSKDVIFIASKLASKKCGRFLFLFIKVFLLYYYNYSFRFIVTVTDVIVFPVIHVIKVDLFYIILNITTFSKTLHFYGR